MLTAISNKPSLVHLLLVLIYLISCRCWEGNPAVAKAWLRGFDTWRVDLNFTNFCVGTSLALFKDVEIKASSKQLSKDESSSVVQAGLIKGVASISRLWALNKQAETNLLCVWNANEQSFFSVMPCCHWWCLQFKIECDWSSWPWHCCNNGEFLDYFEGNGVAKGYLW